METLFTDIGQCVNGDQLWKYDSGFNLGPVELKYGFKTSKRNLPSIIGYLHWKTKICDDFLLDAFFEKF